MANPQIAVAITGKTTSLDAAIAHSEKQMAGVVAVSKKTQQQLQTMSRQNGIEKLTKGFDNATKSSFELFKNVSRIVDPLGVITGGASIAGLTALSQSIANIGQAQVNAARGINMGAQELGAWQNAAKSAGATSEDATSSISGLEKAVSDMKFKNSPANAGAAQILGANWQQKYKSDADILVGISTKLQGLHGQAKASALELAEQTFNLSPAFARDLLMRGPAYVQKELAKGMRSSLSGGQLNGLDGLATGFTHLENSITGAAEAGAASIAPTLIPALNGLSDWIDSHQGIFDAFAASLGLIGSGLGYKVAKRVLGGKGASAAEAAGGDAAAAAGSGVLGWGALAGAAAIDVAGVLDTINHWNAGRASGPWRDTLGQSGTSIRSEAGNAAYIAAAMRAQGAPPSFIAAALGNAAVESGINPQQAQLGGGPGFGLFQWEADRQKLFQQAEGVDIHHANIAQETDFFMREMKNNYRQVYDQLMSGKLDVQKATQLMMHDYLAPADKDDPTGSIVHRTSDAQQWQEIFKDLPAAVPAGSDAPLYVSPESANGGDRHRVPGSSADQVYVAPRTSDGGDGHVVVDINVNHDGTVRARQRQASPGVTANLKTATAMPDAGAHPGMYHSAIDGQWHPA
jgi:hypothetical protein